MRLSRLSDEKNPLESCANPKAHGQVHRGHSDTTANANANADGPRKYFASKF